MEPGGSREDRRYSIAFQVWRLLSEDASVADDGCYSLVGENTFRDISLGEGGLVCEVPAPGEEVAVRPGDVVGFYVQHDGGGDRGIQIEETYSNEEVWFQQDPVVDAPANNPACAYQVGVNNTLQTFTNRAPILSVTVGKFDRADL